jgi:hypothetical protein
VLLSLPEAGVSCQQWVTGCVWDYSLLLAQVRERAEGGTVPLSALMSCGRSQSESACVVKKARWMWMYVSELGKLRITNAILRPG